MEKYFGTWETIDVSNIEEFMEAMEMNAQAREGFRSARPNFEYGKDGPDFIYKFVMPMFTKEYRFHLGEPYDSMGVDGRPVKSVISLNGENLVETHTYEGGNSVSAVRNINPAGELELHSECKGVVMTSRHKRIA